MNKIQLRPSESERWLNCMASPFLCKDLPSSETSSYAAEGTVAHTVCYNKLFFHKKPKEAITFKPGTMIQQDGFTIEVTDDMLSAANIYYEYVKKVLGKIAWTNLYLERKFEIHPQISGTTDAAFFDPNTSTIHIFDFKYGAGVTVEVENNSQLMLYAYGFSKLLSQSGIQVNNVVIHIIQPRRYHDDGACRSQTFTFDELQQFSQIMNETVDIINRINQETYSDYLLQGGHCKWCPAKFSCSKTTETVTEFSVIAVENEKKPVHYSGEDLARFLSQAELIESWISDLRIQALKQAEAGIVIPGYILTQKRANRVWVDEEKAACALEMLYEASEEDLYNKKFISVAQAEKQFGKESVKNLTSKPDNGFTLTKESKSNAKQKVVTFTEIKE